MTVNADTTIAIGHQAELAALDYLKKAGCKLRQKNFRCKAGEIDLVVEECVNGETIIVFVEVRYRRQENFGSGAASVTLKKQGKIIKAAQYYIHVNKLSYLTPCRFDVISITSKEAQASIKWVKAAF